MNQSDILQTTLPNGLTVLLKELHHAPLVSHWVWYRVGARNETPGSTGISHWVEHMQFKGTPRFPASQLDRAISREGGMWNAMTHMDWTAYFETMPAEKIGLALELEADRMVNSVFDKKETEAERTVVISEREGNENDPMFRLGESLLKAAFARHAYRHEVIGEMEDLRAISRDQLYSHYRRHYTPANAVLAAAGDFDSNEMLEHVQAAFGGIPAGEPAACAPETDQPPAREERVVLAGQGDALYLQCAYRAPAARERDFFILTVIDSLLSGPASLAMFGEASVSNKSSRLYKRLVEGDLAAGVSGSLQATIDPYLYTITATIAPDGDYTRTLAAIDDEIKRLQDAPVAEEEIRKAAKQAKALFAYGTESITNQAFWLGYASMFADTTWFSGYVESLESVTPAEVLDAAQRLLQPQRRVVGVYQPVAAGKEGAA